MLDLYGGGVSTLQNVIQTQKCGHVRLSINTHPVLQGFNAHLANSLIYTPESANTHTWRQWCIQGEGALDHGPLCQENSTIGIKRKIWFGLSFLWALVRENLVLPLWNPKYTTTWRRALSKCHGGIPRALLLHTTQGPWITVIPYSSKRAWIVNHFTERERERDGGREEGRESKPSWS